VRPVNLIPLDQRKGAARMAGGGEATPVRIYVVLGALGVALLCVLAVVLTSNSINSKNEELAKVQVQEQSVKQVADALRPYGQFAQLQAARRLQIEGLVSSRFNWERALRQLSRALPDDVWLLSLSGTASPEIEITGSGGGGDVSSLRDKATAPAFAVTGCTFSQHAVARMMTRMQNLDDVTDVQLAKSAKKDEQGATDAAASAAQASSAGAQENTSECSGSARVTTFDMLIVFGAAPGASASGTAGTAAAPTSTAQAVGAAQGAAASTQGASASSTSGTGAGGTP
jgi:Tfp pilus assembly protein PilN